MIGLWIARFGDDGHGDRLTKWHYVESEIADRKIVHCGKQLGDIDGTILAPVQKPPIVTDTCSACAPVLKP